MRHPFSWALWSLTLLAALTLTRNPLYLGLALAVVFGVRQRVVSARRAARPLPFAPWKMALLLTAGAALFNALTAHFGETVLLRLPAGLPLLGGPLTLEALVFGALNGLTLAGLFAAFEVFTLAVPVSGMLRLVPRGFRSLGVVVSIALTFAPVTLRQWQAIREAQAVRGQPGKGLRSLPSLFTPLLVSSLERALQLSEAMTARGFAAPAAEMSLAAQAGMALSLGALLAGWTLAALWGHALSGESLMLAGGVFLTGLTLRQGRRAAHTAYRPARRSKSDWLNALGCGAFLAVWLLPPAGRALAYTPYPLLSRPPFEARYALALLALLVPALAPGGDPADA